MRSQLGTDERGLGPAEAARRLAAAPTPLGRRGSSDIELLVRQFRSPIVVLLVVAAVLSEVLAELEAGC